MKQQAKLKLKKKLKHKKQVQQFYQDAEVRYKKQLEYQKHHGKIPAVMKLGYAYGMDAKLINHHYDDLIGERIKLLSDPKWVEKNLPEDKKDNRTILANLNYIKMTNDNQNMYGGIVIGYRFVKHHNHTSLYLLVKDVYTLVHGQYETTNHKMLDLASHFATDHLWIDTKQVNVPTSHKITIGIGDAVSFLGEVKAYRGKKENIRQTKYGLENVVIIDSGYPKILPNDERLPMFNNFTWFINSNIHYHHHNYLIEFMHDTRNYNKLVTNYGNQWKPEDQPLVDSFNRR